MIRRGWNEIALLFDLHRLKAAAKCQIIAPPGGPIAAREFRQTDWLLNFPSAGFSPGPGTGSATTWGRGLGYTCALTSASFSGSRVFFISFCLHILLVSGLQHHHFLSTV